MNSVTEFELTEGDFTRIRKLVRARAGIDLGDAKRALVYGRLARRVRLHKLTRFSDYLALVEQPEGGEMNAFINALTTNVTEFFRESHHFDYIRDVLGQLRRPENRRRRVRLWCAGCSTGEEPYSLAMVVREVFPDLAGWDLRILATDIDTDALAEASAGVYSAARLKRVPSAARDRWWQPANGGYVAAPALRQLVTFKQLNLLEPWPMSGPFDLIMCRNVIIYFDTPTKLGLVKRFRQLLLGGGHLFLGHSESMVGADLGLEPCGRTAYRRPVDEAA